MTIIKGLLLGLPILIVVHLVLKVGVQILKLIVLAKHVALLDQGRHLWLLNPHDLVCILMNVYNEQ